MTCDDIILPIVIVHSKDMSQFTNGELTLFIKVLILYIPLVFILFKIENGDDNYSLKNKIEAKYGVDWINWDVRCIMIKKIEKQMGKFTSINSIDV